MSLTVLRKMDKCDAILKYLGSNNQKRDDYFEVIIVLKEDVTDLERVNLKSLASVRSMGPRVAVAMVQIDKVYELNELSFVQSISAPTHHDFDRIIGAMLTKAKPEQPTKRKSLFQKFCDMWRWD